MCEAEKKVRDLEFENARLRGQVEGLKAAIEQSEKARSAQTPAASPLPPAVPTFIPFPFPTPTPLPVLPWDKITFPDYPGVPDLLRFRGHGGMCACPQCCPVTYFTTTTTTKANAQLLDPLSKLTDAERLAFTATAPKNLGPSVTVGVMQPLSNVTFGDYRSVS